MLQVAYCSQSSSALVQAVTITGPSMASMTSATEMRRADRESW